jgi:predicted phosphodiesterase
VKLGLITDIHEHVTDLALALEACDRHGVDQIICLGDVMQTGSAIRETVALLAERRIAGVWGNHDFGLCSHPSALASSRRERYTGAVLNYLATFQPSLVLDDCHFSHVEPWRDANDVMALWDTSGLPDQDGMTAQSFDACHQRVMFTGHHHRWLVTTRERVIPWDACTTICLTAPQRYYVVVAAVCEGRCGVYDTSSGELSPIAFRDSGANAMRGATPPPVGGGFGG